MGGSRQNVSRGGESSGSHLRGAMLGQNAKRVARSMVVAGLVMIASCVLAVAAASASTVFSEDWESGSLATHGWTAQDTSTTVTTNDPVWQVLNNPQSISVASPGINPDLVTLPDSGSLPAAHGGTHAVWFGDQSSGTFCGADWATLSQDSKDGCTSSEAYSGTLTSSPINLAGATTATLSFFSWWEIESVNADAYDLMEVEYSADGGTTWSDPVKLNPANNPAGAHDQSYSNNGLEVSPSWHQYIVDLTPAAKASTSGSIEIRFVFDTGDDLYNGFRGWLIDDISVDTPYAVPAPAISAVATCSGTQNNPVTVIAGSNFVEGSQAVVDGSPVTTSVLSSQRIEIDALSDGSHTVQVQAPNGATSSTVTVTAGACAAPSATSTAIASSTNPSTAGQAVTFTATVNPTPDGGTMRFTDGGQTIPGCAATAVNTATGAATCQTTYASAGSHTIMAAYSGDPSFLGSQSPALIQTVKQPAPVCTLTPLNSKVLLKKPKHGKPRTPPGTLTLTADCDQAASVTVAGELTIVNKKPKHGKPTTETFALGPVQATVKAGGAQPVTVKLPAAAISRLRAGANESAAFTLTAVNANGVSHADTSIAKLHGVS